MGPGRFSAGVPRLLAVVSCGCRAGGSPADGTTLTDSAGVVLVASPGEDRALPSRIEEVRRIGGVLFAVENQDNGGSQIGIFRITK